MQRAQNSTPSPAQTTPKDGTDIAPKRAYDRSAYKLFPDPPSTATPVNSSPTRSSPPRHAAAVKKSRRSVSLDASGKSNMLSAARPLQSPSARAPASHEVTSPISPQSVPSSPHAFGRERAASLPGVQGGQQNGSYIPSPMSPRSPQTRYYAKMKAPGDGRPDSDTTGHAGSPFESRTAQVQKLLAAGIKPPPSAPESPSGQRSSSGSSSNPVGLGLSFGSTVTTPDLAMFPRPGPYQGRPQSPTGYNFPRPHSPHGGSVPRPQSPGGYGRPQSPSRAMNSRPQSPSGLGRPHSPFAQPPPRPHSPTGYAPRTGSPLSGNRSRPESPRPQGRTESPLYNPSSFGAKRMMQHDLRVDTSLSGRPPHHTANHRHLYQHQRQNTEYRKQMQGVQPLAEDDMPRAQKSPPQTGNSDRGRSPPREQRSPPADQGTRLEPPTSEREGRKGIRKSRLAKPLPPPPPANSLLPPGPAYDPASDTSRESSRPGSPDSTTSSASPISPVSPMFQQGFGYSNVTTNATTLPSPVSAITSSSFAISALNAPAVPPIPKGVSRKPVPNKSPSATIRSGDSMSSPPLSPPASKFQISVSSPKRQAPPAKPQSPIEDSSSNDADSPKSPRLSESPVRLEKARSIQIQPLDKPNMDGSGHRDSQSSARAIIGEGVSVHRRVPSLVPSLIDLKSPTEHKRPEAIREETTPEVSEGEEKKSASKPQPAAATTSEPTASSKPSTVTETAQPNAQQAGPASLPVQAASRDISPAGVSPSVQSEDKPAQPALRSKSSRARDLISKIEQKVQNDHTLPVPSGYGRRTPNEGSPAPSVKSLKSSASRENVIARKLSTEQLAVRDDSDAKSSSGKSSPIPAQPTTLAPTSAVPSPDPSMHSAVEVLPPEVVETKLDTLESSPAPTSAAKEPEMSASQLARMLVQPDISSSKTDTSKSPSEAEPVKVVEEPLPSPVPRQLQIARAIAARNAGSASTKSEEETIGKPSAQQVSEVPEPVSAPLMPATLSSQQPIASPTVKKDENVVNTASVENASVQTVRSTAEESVSQQAPAVKPQPLAVKRKPAAKADVGQFVVVKSKAAPGSDTASIVSKTDSEPSYKSFFTQEDIFFVEPEFPTYPSGILPSIQEDGIQEEPETEPRPSTSTAQSVPGKISARQMMREDRSSSRGKPLQSSASSIDSSQWSRYDDRPNSSRTDGRPSLLGPGVAPFARENRPSSTDTGVLPANENIKISNLSYESQLAQSPPQEQQKPSENKPAEIVPAEPIKHANPERLDVVPRQNPSTEPRPVSEAPPPVPRKDTVRRPPPKRREGSDKSTAEPMPAAARAIAHDLTRNESSGSVSSINIDAIRARVAGMSERTAKAIEAPSKDEGSLLASLEDLAKQSETLHERYSSLRADRQRITNGMSAFLRDVQPGPGYAASLMDQNAALAAVMSSMDICFAKLKSLDCRKEEAIAALMANVHRKSSSASLTSKYARARGLSNANASSILPSRGPSNATTLTDAARQAPNQEAPNALKSDSPKLQVDSKRSSPQSTTATPDMKQQQTPQPVQRPVQPAPQRPAPTAERIQPQQNGAVGPTPLRTRVKGAKAAKVLGLANQQGEKTEKDITLPDEPDQGENGSRLLVTIGSMKQAKTPPPSRPLPTPPERRRSIVDSVHASIMSLASTPEDPDLWTPHEEDLTPNVLKGAGPPVRDVRVYAEDDFLDYYRNAP